MSGDALTSDPRAQAFSEKDPKLWDPVANSGRAELDVSRISCGSGPSHGRESRQRPTTPPNLVSPVIWPSAPKARRKKVRVKIAMVISTQTGDVESR